MRSNRYTVPILLFLLGIFVHTAWALTIPVPVDWDARYYTLVAQRIVSGEGATTGSLWTLSYEPDALPVSADLHWMPLPSRVLVLGMWFWPAWGGQATVVFLTALWAPLTYLLGRRVGLNGQWATLAGVLATTGGMWARRASTTDVYALYGVIGALAFIALARNSGILLYLVAAAALTRNDGFLLGACLSIGYFASSQWRWGISVGLAGVAPAALWGLRARVVGGPEAAQARLDASSAADYVAFFDGSSEPITILERIWMALEASPSVVEAFGMPGLSILTPFVAYVVWKNRRVPWVLSFAAVAVLAPIAVVFIAPVLGTHGTLGRSAPAIFAPTLVLGVAGLRTFARWGARTRGYHPQFLTYTVALAFIALSFGLGARYAVQEPSERMDCSVLEGTQGPVFSSNPLAWELDCGVPGIMVTRRVTREHAEVLSERYGVNAVIIEPNAHRDEGSIRVVDIPRVFPQFHKP